MARATQRQGRLMAFFEAHPVSLGLALPILLISIAGAHVQNDRQIMILIRVVELLPVLYLLFFTWMYFRWRARVRLTGGRRCPNCDYDVSGLPDAGICPECSEPYDVKANLRNADLPTGDGPKPPRPE